MLSGFCFLFLFSFFFFFSPASSPTSTPGLAPPTSPPRFSFVKPSSERRRRRRGENTCQKSPPLPLSLLHRDNDRLSSHSDQHCHPQHRHARTRAHTHQRRRARTRAHTLAGPTAVKIRTSLDNTDNQVTAVTSVIFTPGPDNTSKILLAPGTTRDHRIRPIRRHASHQISNYLLFNIPN